MIRILYSKRVGSSVKKFKIPFSIDKLKNLYRFYNLKEVYHLIKAFWYDVFLSFEKGAQDHTKAIKTSLIICVIAFLILSLALLKFTESSTFCGLCHQMNAYMIQGGSK